jgi:hypothetical protein
MKYECGFCSHWMKTSSCPRERKCSDGYHRGPSMSDSVCGKYDPDFNLIKTAEDQEAKRRDIEIECRARDAKVMTDLVRSLF